VISKVIYGKGSEMGRVSHPRKVVALPLTVPPSFLLFGRRKEGGVEP